MGNQRLRDIPSVDRLLSRQPTAELIDAFGREAVVDALRAVLESVRADVRDGASIPDDAALVERGSFRLRNQLAPTLRPLINATGVIIHTNLGRAPLSEATRRAIDRIGRGYSTLEYDLQEGSRGHRTVHAERLLCQLTGAESALVVNNNAGAVLLTLTALAQGRGVVISRGQLVEIGGGFRVPDVMAQSGARIIEVGTTNRTHLYDYENVLAVDEEIGLILRAHHSNFRIVGFTSEPSLAELADVGVRHGLPVVDDLGSGALIETTQFGLGHEPMVQESIAGGAAVVCFSGDKLLGGPQAGIITGQAAYVDPLKSHPLARALRPDKLCLAGLQETLLHYLRDEAIEEVPVWRMIATPLDTLANRAASWRDRLQRAGIPCEVVPGHSTVGGGSLPGETLPTKLVAVSTEHPDALATALRQGEPAVIARIESEQLLLDPRTVLEQDQEALLERVMAAAAESPSA